MINFLTKTALVLIKVVVIIVMTIINLAILAFKAAFIKAEEVKDNAPEYRENIKEEFKNLDVSDKTSKFTGVFDSWTTKLSDYVNTHKNPAPQAELLALPAPQKDVA